MVLSLTKLHFRLSMMSGVSAHQAVQGMEALTSAMKANIVPDQEYLLQGSVLDTSLEVLNHR